MQLLGNFFVAVAIYHGQIKHGPVGRRQALHQPQQLVIAQRIEGGGGTVGLIEGSRRRAPAGAGGARWRGSGQWQYKS